MAAPVGTGDAPNIFLICVVCLSIAGGVTQQVGIRFDFGV